MKYPLSHKHWARYPLRAMASARSHTHTCNPNFYMTDSCVSTTLKILQNTPHKDWRSSLAGGGQRTICKDPWLTALLCVGYHSLCVKPASGYYALSSFMLKVLGSLVVVCKHLTSTDSRNPHETSRDWGIKSTPCPGLSKSTHLSGRAGVRPNSVLIPWFCF